MARALAFVLVLALASCGGDAPTELVVVFDSAYAPASPGEPVADDALREVSLVVRDATDASAAPWVDLAQVYTEEGAEPPPFSLGLVLERDPPPTVLVELRARVGPEDDERVIVLQRETGFVAGATKAVPLLLRASCDGSCGAEETCGEAGCEPRAVDGEALEDFSSLEDFTLP
ncbi:MAG TPA: hypothetical protein RMH85_11530 [Polyangiaceae bacterium LLY-WYZ-15_(1-7)]|nr:hypothetical protein [Polyangiaceae bacterium LLY-WYZ-15_(1-7)]HJL09127.1 hypothetical protein [Polyangiaceae bacterium LLY-WYZ-15_(1-7)]HJL38227.1 hypothetical protein [Polyangiaceae bacterium LLY-WYZ-15_(1-7)]HJL47696.1 hypothetical protein [Polyangiaceae bacterium LLY-WYZ-15_(1-7)]